MKSFVLTIFSLCFLSAAVLAQVSSTDIAAVQKEFRKNLMKHTSSVYAVDFRPCEVSIKIVTSLGRITDFGSSPPANLGGAGDIFSSTYSSSSGGGSFQRPESFRYVMDLSKLDPAKIEVSRLVYPKGSSLIKLQTNDNSDAIYIKRKKTTEISPEFRLTAKTKSADKIAAGLKKLITQCSLGQ